MMEDKKVSQTPPPPAVLKAEPEKAPVPVAIVPEKPKKKDKTAEFRRGMASLVGCGNVSDFGAKLRAKIESYRAKIRAKKEAAAQQKEAPTDVRAKLEANRQAYRTAEKPKMPVLPNQEKTQKPQGNRQIPKWCHQRYDRAA